MSVAPVCGVCGREVLLVVREGAPIEHAGRPGFFKVCCGCGLGALEAAPSIPGVRRVEEPKPAVLWEPRPYANQYGASLHGRAALKPANPYEALLAAVEPR